MYKEFFGLRESPFNVNPDPRYLYLTKQTQEAYACLTYGIQTKKGFILLTGEVGTGKTTLLNRLLDWLRTQRATTAFIFNPRLSVTQMLDFMMTDFGIPCESKLKSQVLLRLNQWLLERYKAGETAVLIIDEAQNLSPQVLEEIRLLTNLETSTEKLLQIVLAGQPELEAKLAQPQLRQLRQRITLRSKTLPLSLEETSGYIHERLRIAGATDETIFSEDAIQAIHHFAKGIPRITNLLCEHSLINSFAAQEKPIQRAVIEEVAREYQLDQNDAVLPEVVAAPAGEAAPVVQSLLQNLANLIDRLGQHETALETSRERKT
jgi:type II secretory pathway predicted ATPase ExeA